MSGAVCPKLVRGRVGRFTKLDRCGSIVPGPLNRVDTEGLITVTLTPVTYTKTAIQLPNAAGNLLIDENPTPQFKRFTASAALIGVNPILVTMLTGSELWMSADPDIASGFTIGDDDDPESANVASELWSGVAGNVCEDGSEEWGYFLNPWFRGGTIGAITWANDAINFTIEGMQTQAPNDWGVGPYDVTRDEDGDPSPLLASLGVRKHFLSDLVTLAPPTDECGGKALGQKATTATAGVPGTFGPANSWLPEDLADMTGVTASPGTAWTTGQKVITASGAAVHWTSTAWASGPA